MCSEYSSIHGVQHFMRAGLRKYQFRILWASVFAVFILAFMYFQFNLFYEIAVKKPTIVERYYKRVNSVNFPNVVICDLNQEYDHFDHVASTVMGNITDMILISAQLSLNIMYEPIRTRLRKNITEVLTDFPLLSRQYLAAYSRSDEEWMKTLSPINRLAKNIKWVKI